MNHTDVFSKKYFDCFKPAHFSLTRTQATTMTDQATPTLPLAC